MSGHAAMGGKNSTKFLIVSSFLVVVALIAVTFAMFIGQPKPNAAKEGCDDQTGKKEATIIYKPNEEFGPDCLRISVGTKVIYKNDSSAELAVGADPHPTHTSDRGVTNNEFDLPVERNGGQASVTLTKKGEFGIHNHMNSSARATIIVE
jgi:plastocyanin